MVRCELFNAFLFKMMRKRSDKNSHEEYIAGSGAWTKAEERLGEFTAGEKISSLSDFIASYDYFIRSKFY